MSSKRSFYSGGLSGLDLNSFPCPVEASETGFEFFGSEMQKEGEEKNGCFLEHENGGSNGRSYTGLGRNGHVKLCSRGHWRPAEDSKLKELVAQFGPQNWNLISEHLVGRSGKSCRLRWFNQLDPRINRRAFTDEEEEKLLAAHRLYGNKWALISRLFIGRTDNAVKNHWHVIMAKKHRENSNLYSKIRKLDSDSHVFENKNNGNSFESTISSTVDESNASTCTTKKNSSSSSAIFATFNGLISSPAVQHQSFRSQKGETQKMETRNGLYQNNKNHSNNSSDSNSDVSATESIANTQSNNFSIDLNEKMKIQYIDFLGVGACS